MMSHLHARDQHHLEDMLGAGRGVSHGNVEGPVDAEGHLAHVALRLLPVAIVWHVNVWEHAVKVKTSLLTCNTSDSIIISLNKLKYRVHIYWDSKTHSLTV